MTVPRFIAKFREPTNSVELHSFRDASVKSVGSAVYAVVKQESGTTQGLVTAKSRLAKQNLTIPRLELVAGHMAVNLGVNVRNTIDAVSPTLHCWLDSTVALYWISGCGEHRQFVANRVSKINQHADVIWHHVPTEDNPADLGSRGADVTDSELWKKGPPWLAEPSEWPPKVAVRPSTESRAEAKVIREILATAMPEYDELNELLERGSLWNTLRVCALVHRFVFNCRNQKSKRMYGPITTDEIEKQKLWWVKRAQNRAQCTEKFKLDKLQLNLQPNDDGILECRGRIVGVYPTYLPDYDPFTAKLVHLTHILTHHGGVTLTMAKLRDVYWVPRLRNLTKKVRGNYWECKRFRAKAYEDPPPGNLPTTRTEGDTPYQAVGVDFAGPIKYRISAKTDGKAYLVLFACCLIRGVYLDWLPSLETDKFLPCLKRFIARRGRPSMIYSDNGRTFQAAAKWLDKVQEEEKFHNVLAELGIVWRFNLSRAPWWGGGQFERLIGVFESAFYKAVGNGTLSWNELSELVLDVEVTINGRPLSYLEEDVEMPVLTPSAMLYLRPNQLPELEPHQIQEPDVRSRAKYLRRCKDVLWSRWTKEYLRGLRERHRRCGGEQTPHPSVGDVVIIKDESRNRNTWKLGIVQNLIVGRDGSCKGGVPTSSAAVVPSGVVCGSGPAQASDPVQPNFTTIQACCCSDNLPAHSGYCTRGARAVNIVSYFFLIIVLLYTAS